MAQKTQVTVLDDIDGSEGATTYQIAWAGSTYEVDLSDSHRDELNEALAPFLSVARKVAGRTSGRPARTTGTASLSAKRDELAEIRSWARANGHEVADRGRVPAAVVEAYKNR